MRSLLALMAIALAACGPTGTTPAAASRPSAPHEPPVDLGRGPPRVPRTSTPPVTPRGSVITRALLGGEGIVSGGALALGAHDERYVVGQLQSTVTFGDLPSVSAVGASDAFVLALDASDRPIWVRTFGGTASDTATDVVVDPAGNLYVAGTFESPTIDLGTGPLKNAGGAVNDLFLMKLDAKGKTLWAHRQGDPSEQIDVHVSLDPEGGVVATGWFNGAVDFGAGPVKSPLGKAFFVARVDADGRGLWTRAFGHRNDFAETWSEVVPNGDVIVSAGSDPAIEPGGRPTSKDDLGPVLVRYSSRGDLLGARRFGSGADNLTTTLGRDAEGDLRLAVTSRGAVDLGSGARTPPEGKVALVVARLDVKGDPRWSKTLLTESLTSLAAARVTSEGATIVAGTFQEVLPVGGSRGTGYVIRVDPRGDTEWALRVGEGGRTEMTGLALDSEGRVVVTAAVAPPGTGAYHLWIATLIP